MADVHDGWRYSCDAGLQGSRFADSDDRDVGRSDEPYAGVEAGVSTLTQISSVRHVAESVCTWCVRTENDSWNDFWNLHVFPEQERRIRIHVAWERWTPVVDGNAAGAARRSDDSAGRKPVGNRTRSCGNSRSCEEGRAHVDARLVIPN